MQRELTVRVSQLRGSYFQLGLLQGKELDAPAIQNMLPLYQEMCKKTEADRVKQALKSYAPALKLGDLQWHLTWMSMKH